MKKLSFIPLVATLVLMACGSEEKTGQANVPVEISLSSTMEATLSSTRAVDDTKAQGTQFENNQQVRAWIDDRKNDGSAVQQVDYVKNWLLNTDGTGGMSSAVSGEKYYYPSTGGNIDVYAIHTNAPEAATATTYPAVGGVWTHTVLEDQSTLTNYAQSDLLYGGFQNETKNSTGHHTVNFKHKLSKIEVYLLEDAVQSVPNAKLATAQVYILNTLPNAVFTFTAKQPALVQGGTESAADFQTRYDNYGGSIAAGGTAYTGGIKMYQHTEAAPTGTNKALFAEAIIVPQAVPNTVYFLKVVLADGGVLYAKIPATTFQQGKKYTYDVTVKLLSLEISSTISDWTSSGAVQPVDAEM